MRKGIPILFLLLLVSILAGSRAIAQEWNLVYGDIVMINGGKEEAMKEAKVGAVIFPHWFHRIRFRCKVCHEAIFKMKKGANDIDMEKISSGKQCGVCHDGRIAWDPLYCDRCHAIPWDSQIVKELKLKEGKLKKEMAEKPPQEAQSQQAGSQTQ